MGGSESDNVDQPRRRSPRLKCIGSIYKAENVEIVDLSSEVQKYGEGHGSVVTKQIKIEMMEPEEGNFTRKSSAHVNVLPDSTSDERSLVDITLKDLRQRCKARKRKVLKDISPLEVDSGSYSSLDQLKWQNLYEVKLKQEPDLEEPLINMKLKRLNRSPADNKQKKCARVSSNSLVSKEGVTALSPCLSSDSVQGLSDVMKDSASTNGNVSGDDVRDLDLKRTVGMHFYEGGNSPPASATSLKGDLLDAGIPELVNIKTEIVETCSLDYQIKDNHAVAGNSSADLLQNEPQDSDLTSLSLHKYNESSLSVSEVGKDSHVDSPRYNIVKIGKLEYDALMHKVIFPSAESTLSSIADLGCPEESSNTLSDGVNEDVLENGELASMPSKSPLCCVNEVSTEYRESENYVSLPEIGNEQIGEIKDLLPTPIQNIIPAVLEHMKVSCDCCNHNSISAPADNDHANGESNEKEKILQEITHESTVEQVDCSAIRLGHKVTDVEVTCAVNMVNKDTQDLTSGIPLQQMPTYSQVKDETDEHNLLCKEVYGLEEIFLSGKEDNSCPVEQSGQKLCPLPFTNELHHAAEISTKTDLFSKLEIVLNGQAENATHFSDKNCNLISSDGLRELAAHSHIAAPPRLGENNGLPCADDNLLKHTDDLSSTVEEKLDTTSNRSTIASISHAVVISQEQLECDQESLADHPPKKLLSCRKTISPTSQEKLCQALRGIDLHDVSQFAVRRKRLSFEKWSKDKISSSVLGYKEAEAAEPFVGYEQINKKPRYHTDGPVKKVLLKSEETSGKMPCSCTKTSSIQMHMEKAIEFSQQQMRDIEKLALQLLKGLNSMKDIVEDTLSLEANSSLPSKFTAEQKRTASQNASELEKTTKRWLAIMTKDCNRFGKIIRSADNKSSSPVNGVRKERKITFADEVGGVLCHVKVFEQQPSPPTALGSEQAG